MRLFSFPRILDASSSSLAAAAAAAVAVWSSAPFARPRLCPVGLATPPPHPPPSHPAPRPPRPHTPPTPPTTSRSHSSRSVSAYEPACLPPPHEPQPAMNRPPPFQRPPDRPMSRHAQSHQAYPAYPPASPSQQPSQQPSHAAHAADANSTARRDPFYPPRPQHARHASQGLAGGNNAPQGQAAEGHGQGQGQTAWPNTGTDNRFTPICSGARMLAQRPWPLQLGDADCRRRQAEVQETAMHGNSGRRHGGASTSRPATRYARPLPA